MEGFPLCNRGFPLHSLCYLLQPYSLHHPDFVLATTSPPSILLLLPTHIQQTPPSTTSMGGSLYRSRYPLRKSDLYLNHSSEVPIQKATLSLLIARPPPEPPPHLKHISAFGPMDLLLPSTQKLFLVTSPPSLLSLVRPPRKPPDKFRTTLKATFLRDLCLYHPAPKPPWMLCWSSALYLACLVLLFLFLCVGWCYCFCVIVSLLEFYFIMYCFDLCVVFVVLFSCSVVHA